MSIQDWRPTEPLPLHHSWPLFDTAARFELGQIFDPVADARGNGLPPAVGHWTCDLAEESLRWSDEVYQLFGFPRGAPVRREDSLAVYQEESRVVVERLRAYALRYRRGFTVDVMLRPADGGERGMRLIAAPECEDGRPVRLRGLKFALPPR
jgi:hypothetical protein